MGYPASPERPAMPRQDTADILSYYHSPHAGRAQLPADGPSTPHYPHRQDSYDSVMSTPSDYSSHYSDDERTTPVLSDTMTTPLTSEPDSILTHARRSSNPSRGASDKRRMAIVEMDQNAPHVRQSALLRDKSAVSSSASRSSDEPSKLLTRRGHESRLNGLALVAPPDVSSPNRYIGMSPPLTAPIRPPVATDADPSPTASHSGHARAASEIDTASERKRSIRRKRSRDIGIVSATSTTPFMDLSSVPVIERDDQGLSPPDFQTPYKSRTPSPYPTDTNPMDALGVHPNASSSNSSLGTPYLSRLTTDIDPAPAILRALGAGVSAPNGSPGPLTPEIGQSKRVGDPVAGPVVVGLGNGAGQEWLTPASATTPIAAVTMLGATSRGSSQQSLSNASTSPSSSPYLNYQPGVHSTAGPLPPPPRAVFDIPANTPAPPRPPRLHSPPPRSPRRAFEPLGQTLSPPPPPGMQRNLSDFSIGAVSTSSNEGEERPYLPVVHEREREATDASTASRRSAHRREGAFPPSTSERSTSSLSENDHTITVPARSQTLHVAGAERPSRAGLTRENSWVDVDSSGPSDAEPKRLARVKSLSPVRRSPDPDRELLGGTPRSLKSTLAQFKRFSALPRTPSMQSTRSGSSKGSGSRSRNASPARSMPVPPPKPERVQMSYSEPAPLVVPKKRKEIRPRIRAQWPPPMNFAEVLKKKSALERGLAYAQKLNELALYDAGLGDWVHAVKVGPVKAKAAARGNRPSSLQSSQQSRHLSFNSMMSDDTFPMRRDAYLATDLSPRPSDDLASATSPPPSLPYPNLIPPTPQRPVRTSTLMTSPPSSMRNLPSMPSTLSPPSISFSSSSSSNKSPGGFFASIGRRNSVSKERGEKDKDKDKERGALGGLTRVLSKPAPISHAPALPGGPRAPPGRVKRATTGTQPLVISPPMTSPESSMSRGSTSPDVRSAKRRSSVLKRPGAWGSKAPGGPRGREAEDPEFARQVTKLAELLPQADREVLAGYLRRAGQDVVAIGQYLEDEKSGRIRRD